MSFETHPHKASKDCRKCNRRRIKCDRSLPRCQKCSGRSLDCPGYGLVLKWIQGVASRGPQRGQHLPKQETDIELYVSPAAELLSNEDFRRTGLTSTTTASSPEDESLAIRKFKEQTSDGQMELLLRVYPSPVPEFLQRPLIRRLLHHYDEILAPQLAWVDSLENPWRNLILPIAFESPSLLSSILASAAGDLANRYVAETHSREENLHAFSHYRDKALALSAEHLKYHALCPTNQGPANSILAAIFLLCYHEMKWPQSGLWLLHLRAARSVITCWANRTIALSPPDTMRTFLMQEFYAVNAITDITSFTPPPSTPHTVDLTPPDDNNAIFIGYLRVIRSITQTERQQLTHPHQGQPLDITILHSKLAEAHSHALSCCQTLTLRSLQAKHDFDHILEIFYYSALLYGYRAILDSDAASALSGEARDKLFEHLRRIRDIEPFAQEMAWPVFIAGTECCGRLEEQVTVQEIMEGIVRINGPLDRGRIMGFLRSWWETSDKERRERSWIKVARERAIGGETFLVF